MGFLFSPASQSHVVPRGHAYPFSPGPCPVYGFGRCRQRWRFGADPLAVLRGRREACALAAHAAGPCGRYSTWRKKEEGRKKDNIVLETHV